MQLSRRFYAALFGKLALEADDQEDAVGFLLLGNSLEKAGNRARAQTEYAAALKYKPDHAEARKALGGGRQ